MFGYRLIRESKLEGMQFHIGYLESLNDMKSNSINELYMKQFEYTDRIAELEDSVALYAEAMQEQTVAKNALEHNLNKLLAEDGGNNA